MLCSQAGSRRRPVPNARLDRPNVVPPTTAANVDPRNQSRLLIFILNNFPKHNLDSANSDRRNSLRRFFQSFKKNAPALCYFRCLPAIKPVSWFLTDTKAFRPKDMNRLAGDIQGNRLHIFSEPLLPGLRQLRSQWLPATLVHQRIHR